MEELGLVSLGHVDERRRWERIPITIPLFVRAAGEGQRKFLEFGNVLNLSSGGALLAVRQSLPAPCLVSLEIPAAPVTESTGLPPSARLIEAKLLRVQAADRCFLWAVKFLRPLVSRAPGSGRVRLFPRTLRRAALVREKE